jgi:hypothetical protein
VFEQDKAEADEKLALGLMTNLQRLKMEEDFENQKYVINKKALIEQLKLADKDPTKNLVERQKIMDQILLMEQKIRESKSSKKHCILCWVKVGKEDSFADKTEHLRQNNHAHNDECSTHH